MKTFTLTLCAVFFCGSIWAQTNSGDQNYLAIGFTPLNLIEPITSTIETTLDFQMANGLNLELRYGFPFLAGKNQKGRINNQYYEFKAGIRYLRGSSFWGLEYGLVDQNYERQHNWYRTESGEILQYKSAAIERTVHALRLKAGFIWELGERDNFLLEFYQGIGGRNVRLIYDAPSAFESGDHLWDEWFAPIDRTEGAKLRLDYVIGMKLGFKIAHW